MNKKIIFYLIFLFLFLSLLIYASWFLAHLVFSYNVPLLDKVALVSASLVSYLGFDCAYDILKFIFKKLIPDLKKRISEASASENK